MLPNHIFRIAKEGSLYLFLRALNLLRWWLLFLCRRTALVADTATPSSTFSWWLLLLLGRFGLAVGLLASSLLATVGLGFIFFLFLATLLLHLFFLFIVGLCLGRAFGRFVLGSRFVLIATASLLIFFGYLTGLLRNQCQRAGSP